MVRREELIDEQWALIEPLFDIPASTQTRGRPRRPDREVFNGVLWILRSGARWCDLPDRFPQYQTCHSRFQQWVKDGRLKRVLETLAEDLRIRIHLRCSCQENLFRITRRVLQQRHTPTPASILLCPHTNICNRGLDIDTTLGDYLWRIDKVIALHNHIGNTY